MTLQADLEIRYDITGRPRDKIYDIKGSPKDKIHKEGVCSYISFNFYVINIFFKLQ